MRKYQIALMLAKRYGYTRYLEICTPTTGRTFAKVDKRQFQQRVRLMYRCPASFSDGIRGDYVTEAESGEALLSELVKSGERFDLVFVDAWHAYANAWQDILFGLQLIKEGGVVLVHDCNPTSAMCASLEAHSRGWCGVTFAAYLDIVLFNPALHYATVNTDYGCGIISKDDRLADFSKDRPTAALTAEWQALALSQKYSFFHLNRVPLLRLISREEFRRKIEMLT